MDETRRPFAPGVAVVTVALAFAVLMAAAPGAAYGDMVDDDDELYEPLVVAVSDDPGASVSEALTTYQKTAGDLKVVLCGVTDANKDALADAVLANVGKGIPVKFVNSNFVDADKYSVTCDDYDMYQCWLGSTSNILTITGWASRYKNPLTSAAFTDEDDVFAFMSSGFQDQSCLPSLAYSYFFDGLFGATAHYGIRTFAPSASKPFAGMGHTGFDPQVCSSKLVSRVECDGSASALRVLESLQSRAVEMSIGGATSHSVAVVGAVVDTGKQGVERYPAVLIADTDNEPSTSASAPASFDEANVARAGKTNSYTLYHLASSTDYGRKVVQVKNYLKSEYITTASSFTQVTYCSDAARSSALETSGNATCNAKTTGDVALESLGVFNQDYDSPAAYKFTDKITLQAIIDDMNADVRFNSKTTGKRYLENEVAVYRNGKRVGTIGKAAWLDLTDGIDMRIGSRLNIDLSKFKFMRNAGTYTLRFFLNTEGVSEAYVLNNNSPQSISFTIMKGANPIVVKAGKKSFKRGKNKVRKVRLRVMKAKGKVTFKKAKRYAMVRINRKGVITFDRGCKRGVYKFKVKVAGNSNYRPATKTVKIVVR